ncbi:peptidase M28 family protein [Sphingomonas koreensis]|jgi:carboxypeptidase Q|uniref:Carboxypeptidase Q n=1 Tax=Sphingomonas koreensis TaxID=93064 RepID=A0A1L6JBG2_9SPHN|nr:M28 family peptidase [Sphingomonas koreensis]APR53278.1 peptidase M28 family protein [Sphingomonas koreensis]MDC7810037.1 M28 family peptidase [Sphingomonas koreensis]RSU24598.1 peptidase M28 family protein [Sphingomonas koreensis]RSU27132.1 peptidase M28 family protein [Sphingomonas koreensis]RSU30080.1 peptidase M28 family protein [Sphingomonas koreensis]
MRVKTLTLAAVLSLPLPALAQIDPAALRDAALKDEIAWDITEGLTTEIGPRLAGTEAEARARAWSVKKLAALGFSNVRNEPFRMKTWIRGEETLEVLAPFPQPLRLTALGNSGATPATGLRGEIVYFKDIAALHAVPDGSLRGKIAFVSHDMTRTQDGSQYGAFGAVRRSGPAVAARKGAAAILIRSVGTDYHRNPHAGGTGFPEGVTPIPAAALSIPDAEQLQRILKRGQPVSVKLTLTPRQVGMTESGNIIAEVPGSDPAAGLVVVACHLDSWDLGTGAFDDGAGCGIVTAAAKRVMDAGEPRRTIRILWAGAEEVGVFGGKAYFEAHKGEKHALAAESDFGADRIWRVDFKLPESARAVGDRVAAVLSPLGISRGRDPASGGADVAALVASGVAGIDLQQDGSRYFDLHHTPDDTLDKIDPSQLRQNVAAWTAMLAVVANAPEEIGATQ